MLGGDKVTPLHLSTPCPTLPMGPGKTILGGDYPAAQPILNPARKSQWAISCPLPWQVCQRNQTAS